MFWGKLRIQGTGSILDTDGAKKKKSYLYAAVGQLASSAPPPRTSLHQLVRMHQDHKSSSKPTYCQHCPDCNRKGRKWQKTEEAGGRRKDIEDSRSRSQLPRVRKHTASSLQTKQAAGLITSFIRNIINTSDTLRKAIKRLHGEKLEEYTKWTTSTPADEITFVIISVSALIHQ